MHSSSTKLPKRVQPTLFSFFFSFLFFFFSSFFPFHSTAYSYIVVLNSVRLLLLHCIFWKVLLSQGLGFVGCSKLWWRENKLNNSFICLLWNKKMEIEHHFCFHSNINYDGLFFYVLFQKQKKSKRKIYWTQTHSKSLCSLKCSKCVCKIGWSDPM